MKVRVVYKPDKTVAVIHPAPKSRRPDETEEAWLKRVFAKAMKGELEGLPYDDIEDTELPSREFRHQWRGKKGKGISLDKSVLSVTEQKKQRYQSAKTTDKKLDIIAEKLGLK